MPLFALSPGRRGVRLALLIVAASAGGVALGAPAPAPLAPEDARQIEAAIAGAIDQGFSRSAFPAAPDAAAIAYGQAQHGGRIPLSLFAKDWAIRPAPYAGDVEFGRAVAERRVPAWLASLPPPDGRYGRLARAYGVYRTIAGRGGWPLLPTGVRPKPGDGGPAVAALRARLAIEDPGVPSGATYDESLAAAVARAQVRHGLTADGRVGPATIAALNVSAETRLAQIAANLERWRWTPRALPTPRIEINTADASLVLQDGVSPAMSMRAIVGKPSWRTPMFVDRVTAVVFNPPWNVPEKIARAEVWPKIRRDPGYLAREGFVVRPGGGLQQLPGPRCALGLIKFDLANPFGVYLHDTPSRSLFALDRRALSHGCMRLENPVELGKRLLATDPNWSENAVNLALLGGKTVRVPVARPVPVYVFHWTVFVDDEGAVQFRPDVYGWDAEIGRLLRTSRTPDRDGA